jgi:hypothetical protein
VGFLDSLKSLFSGGGSQQEAAYWLYVRCRRCGEVIRSRIDLRNDLSLSDGGGYSVSKTLVGSKLCFQRIEVTLTFDDERRLVDREISGGEFITAEEFESAAGS